VEYDGSTLLLGGIHYHEGGVCPGVGMASVELTRQEIWTILCWAGDEGDSERMPGFYNQEEASVLRKLRAALTEENARFEAGMEAIRKRIDAASEKQSAAAP